MTSFNDANLFIIDKTNQILKAFKKNFFVISATNMYTDIVFYSSKQKTREM